MKRIIVDLGFANLVAEDIDNDSSIPKVVLCLEDKETGSLIQDIALISQAVDSKTGKAIDDKVRCLVWADHMDESYTHEFVIEKYKEPKEVAVVTESQPSEFPSAPQTSDFLASMLVCKGQRADGRDGKCIDPSMHNHGCYCCPIGDGQLFEPQPLD